MLEPGARPIALEPSVDIYRCEDSGWTDPWNHAGIAGVEDLESLACREDFI